MKPKRAAKRELTPFDDADLDQVSGGVHPVPMVLGGLWLANTLWAGYRAYQTRKQPQHARGGEPSRDAG